MPRRAIWLLLLLASCSRMKKPESPPPVCYHTSAHKDWIDPTTCRKWEDIGPVFIPEPEKTAEKEKVRAP